MTTPNDRWAEKAREIADDIKWSVRSRTMFFHIEMVGNPADKIAYALHSAEKEGVRRGMEKATTLLSKLDPLETNSHGWEYGEMETVATDIHNRYVDALREEANKESL